MAEVENLVGTLSRCGALALERVSEEEGEVEQVGHLVLGDEREGAATPPSPCHPPHPVQENLRGGQVVVDDVVEPGDVYPSGGDVSHEQVGGLLPEEERGLDLPGRVVQRAVEVGALESALPQQLLEVLDVAASGEEDGGEAVLGDRGSYQMQEGCLLVFLSQEKVGQAEGGA